jgi:EmrB/QacA subfamily drug resistance transporter
VTELPLVQQPDPTPSARGLTSSSPSEVLAEVRPGPSRWLVFGIVAIGLFMSTVDLTIVATALPAIHQSLGSTVNWTGWTITIYGLGTVVAAPIAGKFSDQYGRRLVLTSGVVVFTLASLACGFASGIYMLIAFRAVQALGGGVFQPSGAGLVADHFGKDRDRAIGMFGTMTSVGQVTGPILGGLIVGYLSWRWIFFVNVPLGVLLIGLVVRFVPESRLLAKTQTDIRGILLAAFGILAAMFGITSLGNASTDFYAPIVVVPIACSVVLLVMFVRHSERHEAPFIPMRLLRGKGFGVVNTLSGLMGVSAFGVMSLVPLYAEQRYHLPVLSAGSLLTARAFVMAVVAAVAAFALRRTGYRLPLAFGFALMACGTLLLSVAPRWGISPYLWLTISVSVIGFGLGAGVPSLSNASLHLSPRDVATVTALRNMFGYIGVIFAVAVTTAVLNRSADPPIAQSHVYWVVAAMLVFVMIPMAFRVSDHKGAW